MTANSLVLVTGVSGFLGAHVVHQLLEAGYRVRGTARSNKAEFVQKWYTQYGDRIEIVPLDDLIHSDYSSALRGVDAILHVAAPLAGRSATHAEQIDAAVEGTRNILEQAEIAGVTKFTLVSSIITALPISRFGEGPLVTDKASDWNPVTRDQGLSPEADVYTVYGAEKTVAEQYLWDFADKHPHMDCASVNPSFFLGPFAPEWRASEPGIPALSTDRILYSFLRPDGPLMERLTSIDVRDVARSLVLSLSAPPTSQVGRKRFVMTGPSIQPREAAEYIAHERHELQDRISEMWKKAGPAQETNIDNSRAKEVLGLEFTDWHKTVLEGVDALIAIEKEWKQQGWVPPQ
ncbi:hypothetical protein EIP86_005102 [Pleurotus ostreatoroseus]|nr:hypothetical protein EIP86_005102 [Pleurotus ostreatoroseus]